MVPQKVKRKKPGRNPLVNYPKYAEAIGIIAVETVDLEFVLATLLASVLHVREKVGRAIFLAPKSEQARLDILRDAANAEFESNPRALPGAIVEKQKARALRKVSKIILRSQDAMNRRHRTVHDQWDVSAPGEPRLCRWSR